MRTITTHTTVYKFDELPEDAKAKALERYYDINVDHDWWDHTWEDAKTIGCRITEFDVDYRGYCRLTCKDAHETARLIVENHGDTCDTFKLAAQYLKEYAEGGENQDELDREFQRALGEEYLSILRQEYEYLTSEEAIKETIEANDYDFTIEGRIF